MATAKKSTTQRSGFKTGEHIVYPAHGVGRIVGIETQEVAGHKLDLFVISFIKDKMTLRVPTMKATAVGMRKLADARPVKRSLETVRGRARIKRTMWSRRAQEYEAKINSGDLISIAEVVRDLFRSEKPARAVLLRAPALRGRPRPHVARDFVGQQDFGDRGDPPDRAEPRQEPAPRRAARGRGARTPRPPDRPSPLDVSKASGRQAGRLFVCRRLNRRLTLERKVVHDVHLIVCRQTLPTADRLLPWGDSSGGP
jgi:RNA polymerase-interacting CarD/CdnL/TRCF family regulator